MRLINVKFHLGHKILCLKLRQFNSVFINRCSLNFNRCGHEDQRKCHQKEDEVKCGTLVEYSFPKCGHLSPHRKPCSSPIQHECKATVSFNGKCGHPLTRKCHENEGSIVCPVPCVKTRVCGHVCGNKCGENCEKRDCKECLKTAEEKLQKSKEEAKSKVKQLAEQIKAKGGAKNCLIIRELTKSGPDHSEYLDVHDQVMKSIQPMHNWTPHITKIEKVSNLQHEMWFQRAKSEAFGDREADKFHGTGDEGVAGITRDGFRLPPQNAANRGMYGQGIYFATDSSKSAQELYTKGSNKLLLCRVLLGKSLELRQASTYMNRDKLRKDGFDSVFAPRGSKGSGGVDNDEFIVFDKRQAYVKYIIHFNSHGYKIDRMYEIISNKDYDRVKLEPMRTFDPKNPKMQTFLMAQGIFSRMSAMYSGSGNRKREIDYVEFIKNTKLETKFNRKKDEFKKKKIPDDVMYAFHATDASNIDSILRTNLDPNRPVVHGSAHGKGCYFSEFPDFSLNYGKGLILFKLLAGNEYTGRDHVIPAKFQSKKVAANDQGYGQQIIITNADQFMPYFVYHLK